MPFKNVTFEKVKKEVKNLILANRIEERSELKVGGSQHLFPLLKICLVILTLAWSRCHKHILQEGAPNALALGGGLCLNT